MTRPIAQAATTTEYFERARVHHTCAEFKFHELRDANRVGLAFRPLGVTTTVRNYVMNSVTLDADSGVLFQGGEDIPETSYFVPWWADRTSVRSRLVKLDDCEDAIIGYNNAHWGYQHWLTQCVPAINWSLRKKRTRPVRLVLPPLAGWQEEILDLLGHGRIPRITLEANTSYYLPNAEYSDFLNGTVSFDVCMSIYDTMRRVLTLQPPTHDRRHPILFVPCSSPYYGTMSNSEDVTEFIRRRGVHVVDSHLSVSARINLFRNAEVVIGPVGQDLANVLFCNPGTLLWEWMPHHHQNPSFNRLAQGAQVDYWGDVFQSDAGSELPRQWTVDIEVVDQRLSEIAERLALRVADPGKTIKRVPQLQTAGKPINELMLAFESLGDNCEFGLVQRRAGAEPLGLLRFAGTSLTKLLAALASQFNGIGTVDTVAVYLAGGPDSREFMVHETWLDTRYHTFIGEREITAEELREREAKRLSFLRRKILADLESGEKIWVWRECNCSDVERIWPLVRALQSFGSNTLLWVVAADDDHLPGTAERLDDRFIKGYVDRLVTYDDATNISAPSWYMVCEHAYDLCYPEQVQLDPAEAPDPPPVLPLSAMEFLSQHSGASLQDAPPSLSKRKRRFWCLWF